MASDSPNLLSLCDMQTEELEMLKGFRMFCSAKGLKFSLYGGTLLGAARHKGFIPWDDDVDVAMPRPDYQKLVSMAQDFEEKTGFRLSGCWPLSPCDAVYCKIKNTEIRVSSPRIDWEDYLSIDVFPIDGMPDDREMASRHCRVANMLRLEYVAVSTPLRAAKRTARKVAKILVRLKNAFNSPTEIAGKLREWAFSVPYGSTSHVGLLVWTPYGAREIVDISSFENLVELEFEGFPFPCISHWDEHLSLKYGNYMELPPVEDQVAHDFSAWRAQ